MNDPLIIDEGFTLVRSTPAGNIYLVRFEKNDEPIEIEETDEGEKEDAIAKAARERFVSIRPNGEELWTNEVSIAEDFLGAQLDLFAEAA